MLTRTRHRDAVPISISPNFQFFMCSPNRRPNRLTSQSDGLVRRLPTCVTIRGGRSGSGHCPKSSLPYPKPSPFRSDRFGMAQRAVAIRALRWRLRVEPELTSRFGNRLQRSTSQGVLGQSPLPVGHRGRAAARRLLDRVHSFSDGGSEARSK